MATTLTNIFPTSVGIIHFIGIGGIGISALAEIMFNLGYKVQGSDLSENYVTERLKRLGIKVFKNHNKENIQGVSYIVKSTDISENNIEIITAREQEIPILKRSEMLAEIMRFKYSISISGTHGKTTTTSLVAHLFEKAAMNPTVINGGIINTKGTNAYIGEGEYLIVEADESDGTFTKIPSYVAVITNIDPEHLNYFHTFETSIAAYRTFILNLPFYGFAILCYDHPIVKQLGQSIKERRILSYGIENADVDFRAVNIERDSFGSTFDVMISEKYTTFKKLDFNIIKGIKLNLNGLHNILNVLSAIAIGIEKNFDKEILKNAYRDFEGVKRRFTKTGEVKEVTIIDDYAHHPVEIKVTLETARHAANLKKGRVIVVMQPHRYSRLKDLMDDFSYAFKDADELIISDIYSGGESEIAGINTNELIRKIKVNTKQNPIYLKDLENLPDLIYKLAKPCDFVIFLGAGDITKWAHDLPKQLEKLYKN